MLIFLSASWIADSLVRTSTTRTSYHIILHWTLSSSLYSMFTNWWSPSCWPNIYYFSSYFSSTISFSTSFLLSLYCFLPFILYRSLNISISLSISLSILLSFSQLLSLSYSFTYFLFLFFTFTLISLLLFPIYPSIGTDSAFASIGTDGVNFFSNEVANFLGPKCLKNFEKR